MGSGNFRFWRSTKTVLKSVQKREHCGEWRVSTAPGELFASGPELRSAKTDSPISYSKSHSCTSWSQLRRRYSGPLYSVLLGI